MSKLRVEADNPNILSQKDIEELGLEEASSDLGPSWEEVEAAVAAKEKKNGEDKNEQTSC